MRRSKMKSFCHFRSSLKKSNGFTLVELLVVMGIIAILAAVLVSAAGYAIKAAQRAKAQNLATQIQTSVLNYYTEYSVYPVPTGTATDYTIADNDTTAWPILIEALCGNINPYNGSAVAATTIANTRGIAFLSLKSTDVVSSTYVGPKNPLPPDSTHTTFNIAIDSDYDNILGVTPSAVTTLPNFATGTPTSITLTGGSCTTGCAVWANCTTKPAVNTGNAGNWVHTY